MPIAKFKLKPSKFKPSKFKLPKNRSLGGSPSPFFFFFTHAFMSNPCAVQCAERIKMKTTVLHLTTALGCCSAVYNRVLISDSSAARCLDGSPPGFYVHIPAAAVRSKRFVVWWVDNVTYTGWPQGVCMQQ